MTAATTPQTDNRRPDPGGKVADSTSAHVTPERSVPTTSLTRWTRPGCDSGAHSRSTATVPGSQTCCRSLRTRSTIMTFSATSLVSIASIAGAVPLIGLETSRGPSRVR